MVSLHTLVLYKDGLYFMKEAEASKEGNGWIGAILKGMKRSSPTALKITLRSVRIFGVKITILSFVNYEQRYASDRFF